MKIIVIAIACLLGGAAVLLGQTPMKAPSVAAGLGKNEATASAEMNIRAYVELLRTDVRKSKAEILGAVMQLGAEDATKFWPIYKDFGTEYTKLGDQIVAVVNSYFMTRLRNPLDSQDHNQNNLRYSTGINFYFGAQQTRWPGRISTAAADRQPGLWRPSRRPATGRAVSE